MYIVYDKDGEVLTICSTEKTLYLFLSEEGVDKTTVERIDCPKTLRTYLLKGRA